MREIKFRVWDIEGKKWVFPVIDITNNFSIDQTKKYDWQQYTGLKDKNGKEVFEGDIIKCPVSINKHIFGEFQNRIVEWKEDSFTWVFDSPFSWGRFEDNLTGDGDYIKYTEEGVIVLIEVIGNIHEHKHLIS